MVTEGDGGRAATFAFARQLRDPDFRRYLCDLGLHEGQDIVVALDDEPATRVFERILRQTSPPAVVALPRPHEKWGFVFLTVEPTDDPAGDHAGVGDGATIGMLYDTAARGVRTFRIPNMWYKQVGVGRLDLAGV
jgi:hypothetical protein